MNCIISFKNKILFDLPMLLSLLLSIVYVILLPSLINCRFTDKVCSVYSRLKIQRSMHNTSDLNPGNEFLLHLKSSDIEKMDRLFLELLADKAFGAMLIGRKIFKEENKVAYRMKIAAPALILFKKRFDALIEYDSLELFEYKEW
jgi:hypothetical protein